MPRPKFVRAVPALTKSERLFAGSSGVKPSADCLPSKLDQSAVERRPLFDALAVGIFKVKIPPRDTGEPEILKSLPDVPVENEIDEFARLAFGIPVGKSVATSERNTGEPETPSGEANTVFAFWLSSDADNVPLVVIGELETLKILGRDKPTDVTVPLPLSAISPLPKIEDPPIVLIFVPETSKSCLLLKVVKSRAVRSPRARDDADGILKV